MTVTPTPGPQLQAAFPSDMYLRLRANEPSDLRRAAVGGTTWSFRSRSDYWESDWVMMHSASQNPDIRAAETAEHLAWHYSFPDGAAIGGVTFAEHTELPEGYVVEVSNGWSWFWTDASRAHAALSASVMVVDHHDPRLLDVLQHSATASHERDGLVPDIWLGMEVDGQLACVAAVNVVADSTNLQSVVTRSDFRGRGLARTVCSHATAWSLQRATYATLGMMSDNAIARSIYLGLGFTCDKEFRSARFSQSAQSQAE